MSNTIISYTGEVIQLPYFGCYAGCAQDYCFVFGKEVSSLAFNFIIALAIAITFGVGLLFVVFILKNCYASKEENGK